ncbi:MAG: zinc ribbon domain-containing protein [Deltaproteobacteria bacterium]|nr:zinc ribbon domain-containing protein [Deltaproteobacteria bacterium]
MPIYEYKCKKCGKEYELFQKITDPAAKTCKFCKGPAHKLISLSSFHLRGSGWYVTDYGGKKAPTGEKKKEVSETPASTESGSASESSSNTSKED